MATRSSMGEPRRLPAVASTLVSLLTRFRRERRSRDHRVAAPTFPGPGGGARTPDTVGPSTSPYGPAAEMMIPTSSATSNRGSRFLVPSSASYRKSTFGAALANLASPLLSPREQHTPEP